MFSHEIQRNTIENASQALMTTLIMLIKPVSLIHTSVRDGVLITA